MCENQFHILIHKSISTWVSEILVQQLGSVECYLWETYLTCHQCVVIMWEKCTNSHKIGMGCSTPLIDSIYLLNWEFRYPHGSFGKLGREPWESHMFPIRMSCSVCLNVATGADWAAAAT